MRQFIGKMDIPKTPTFINDHNYKPDILVANVWRVPFEKWIPGNAPGIYLVEIYPNNILTTLHKAEKGEKVEAHFVSRREHEEHVLTLISSNKKYTPCKKATCVVYSHETLGKEATYEDSDYEIVSINGSPLEMDVPQHPVSMARNSLNKEGGTEVHYTPEQWAESVWFWSTWTY